MSCRSSISITPHECLQQKDGKKLKSFSIRERDGTFEGKKSILYHYLLLWLKFLELEAVQKAAIDDF